MVTSEALWERERKKNNKTQTTGDASNYGGMTHAEDLKDGGFKKERGEGDGDRLWQPHWGARVNQLLRSYPRLMKASRMTLKFHPTLWERGPPLKCLSIWLWKI